MNVTQAKIGMDVNSTDSTRLGWLINDAASIIYNDSKWWGRWLVLEPRTAERGYIQFAEDSYNVYGAGTSEANGLYTKYTGGGFSQVAYELLGEDGEVLFEMTRGAFYEYWRIVRKSDSATLYTYDDGQENLTPPETGWEAEDGEDPAPIVQATSEIGEYIGHWNGNAFQCGSSTAAGSAYNDHNGIRITGCPQNGTVYVAYKKSNTDVYGDGTEGTVTDIPAEFFEFMTTHAARTWQESQGDPRIPLSSVQNAENRALININKQAVQETIANRFRTYYGMDVSVR